MHFVRGNLALRDHAEAGKDVHLFEETRKGFVRYVGQFVASGFDSRDAPDTSGKMRKAIVFELVPLSKFAETPTGSETGSEEPGEDQTLGRASLQELRDKALASSASARTATERKALTRLRSQAIKLYVLKRAGGRCEGCRAPAPFRTRAGTPYLEPHHVRRLSDGGPDHPRWVIAVCANCHRRAHYSADAAEYNEYLNKIAGTLEES
jgi:5-methylcytosine-specific restriction protein A